VAESKTSEEAIKESLKAKQPMQSEESKQSKNRRNKNKGKK